MKFRVHFLTLFLSILILSCSNTKKEEKLTNAEARQVAHNIDSCINQREPRYLDELFDEKALAGKIRSQLDASAPADELLSDMKNSLRKAALGDKIIESMGKDGTYELVKQYEKNNVQHLLFRLYATDGINYHDFELSKRNGKAGIADVFIYMTGEDLSKTLASLMSSFNTKFKMHGESAMDFPNAIKRIRDLVMDNEFSKAYDYYQTLPEDIKNERAVQLMYLQVCKGYSDEKYLQALNDFQARYPNDPNLDLLMIDAYIMSKQFPRAISSINKLDSFINKDTFLDYFRGLIYKMDNKNDTARIYLEQLYKNYPEFDDGVLELIANYITSGMDDKANALIKVYERNPKFDQSTLTYYLASQPQFKKDDSISPK